MEDKIENLLSFCSEVDFGAINLSDREKEFCSEMNEEIVSFCKVLPESIQTDALLFFMRYFRIPFGKTISFFSNYYAPSWSIIHWLIQSAPGSKGLEQEDIQNAKSAHCMALLLHPLDDHLNDGQLPATHLALLLRSQSWMIMNISFKSLADGVEGGEEIVQSFIDDYYSSICSSELIESLENYCDHFRKQMATWLIVPVLVTKKIGADEEFANTIQAAYESFGIAWRLLDDINDIETDMMKGIHSSIYCCLPEKIKNHWDKDTENKNSGCTRIILNSVLEIGIIDRIKEKICGELKSAASIANDLNITGWADEVRCLMKPFKIEQSQKD